jgi:hypothetical protein
MKQQLSIALTKLTFLGVISFIATSAQGQSLSTVVRVDIPFDFIVADKTFEAGEYSFNPVQDNTTVFRISEVDGRFNSVCLTHSVQRPVPNAKNTLVFHRYGNQYFLKQIWAAGTTSGRQMFKSRKESELERSRRRNSPVGKVNKDRRQVETVTTVGTFE